MIRHIKNIILIGMVIMVSCKPDKTNIPLDSSISEIQEEVTISSIGVVLSPKARILTKDWLKFQDVKSKIENYSKVTKTEALQNAKELSDFIIDVSDTIDVKILDRADMKIRFNVLNNHVLRLDDMSTIPSITDEEVKSEVAKVLGAFSSINEKINTLVKIDGFDIKSDEAADVKEEIEALRGKNISKPSSRISTKERLENRKIKRRELLRKKNLKKDD